ncbi:MAG: antA/AntB antirepressor family protein [Roseobacter sp.]
MNIAIHDENFNGELTKTVNARELHEWLENKDHFSTWIKDRISQYGFVEGGDFVVIRETPKNSSGGRPATDYYISLDMAKELSMVERNEKGKEARQYFIDCERQAKSNVVAFNPDDPAQLRGLLVNYAERTEIAEARVVELEPRAEAYDRLEASDGSVTPRVAAKMLDFPERKFTKWLEVNSWAFRQGRVLQGYAGRRKQGYLEHEPRTFIDGMGEERTTMQMKVTPKGLARLAKVLPREGGAA